MNKRAGRTKIVATQKGFHLEPDPFMTRAFANGRAARLAGILPSPIPQEATSCSQAWMLGWKSVKDASVPGRSQTSDASVNPK